MLPWAGRQNKLRALASQAPPGQQHSQARLAGGTCPLTIIVCECCWGDRQSRVPHTEAAATVISAQRTELLTMPFWSYCRAEIMSKRAECSLCGHERFSLPHAAQRPGNVAPSSSTRASAVLLCEVTPSCR